MTCCRRLCLFVVLGAAMPVVAHDVSWVRAGYLCGPFPESQQSPSTPGQARLAGVQVEVAASGEVRGVKILQHSGDPVFDAAVTQAMGRWTFSPKIALGAKREDHVLYKVESDGPRRARITQAQDRLSLRRTWVIREAACPTG